MNKKMRKSAKAKQKPNDFSITLPATICILFFFSLLMMMMMMMTIIIYFF